MHVPCMMEWFDVSTLLDMVYFDRGILDSCHMQLCLVFVFNFMPIINQWWCCKFWRDLNFVSLFVMYIIELLNENAGQFETLLKGEMMSQYYFSGWNYITHFLKFNNQFLTVGKRINGSPTLFMIVEVLKTKCCHESTSNFFHIGC